MSAFDSPHLSEDELFRYCDGELPEKRAAAARQHLETCWQCRAELDELQKTVSDCMRFRKVILGSYLPPPPVPWRDLRRQFADADSELGSRSFWAGVGEFLLAPVRRPARWAPAALALLLIAAIVYRFRDAPGVQAAELLQKAAATSKKEPVRPKRLRIRTGGVQVTRVVNSTQTTAEKTQLAPIEAMFVASHYDWSDPLSPASYLAWHQQLPEKSAGVQRADSAYTIRTTTQSSELVEATLKLREHDLHAVEGTFRFRNEQSVEITELPGEAAAPVLSAGTPGTAVRASPDVHEAPPEPAKAPVEATAGDELRVIAALHRIGADLGDPLEVIRSPKQVVVTGVGIEPSRRAEIARILETMPRVATRFDEPAAGAALPLRTTVRRPSMSEPLLRLQARLEKHVGGRPSFERFSDHLLESVDTMMAHAHALRRLAERFPQRVEESLTEHEQPVLDRLRTEHRNAIRREVGGIEASLAPALRSIGAQSQPFSLSSQSPDWQSNAERLLEAARELERLMAGVLGGAVLEDSRLEAELPSHLLTSIERMLAESGRESTQ